MEEQKNNIIEEFRAKAHAICNEYDEKIKMIRKQHPIKGRGEYPEEMILRREHDEKIRQLAKQYRNN